MKRCVLLGIGVGTDSSVASLLLQDQGYEVIGITFLFADNKPANIKAIKEKKQITKAVNIKHIIIDLREEFRKIIIENFLDQYKNGRTLSLYKV